jgi:DNA-binding SARP family transcriptional activator/predicted ATPase
MAGPPQLHVRLLGQFGATLDGRPLRKLAGARLQSLLTYLALHDAVPQSRLHIAFLFWPDAEESNARNNLRQLLHQLREALGEAHEVLRTTASSVQWDSQSSCRIDAIEFQEALAKAAELKASGDVPGRQSALKRAVDLCAGPLVPSCYDDWVVSERDRFAHGCIQAVRQLVELIESAREYKTAIPYVEHWIEHNPTDEEGYRWLMRLHALCNDRAAALRVFKDCCETLDRELDTGPSEPTLRLHDRIKTDDRTIVGDAHERRTSGPLLQLVGRVDEWSTLRAAWDVAAAGAAHFALIEGEAGIGKSRLATELVSWAAHQGFATAQTRCYAAEGRLALAPVTDWLRSAALRPTLEQLDDVWFTEVTRVVPELTSERLRTPEGGFGERQRLFEGLARAVQAAPAPLLLVIDDLQWCDLETLQWLRFLLRFEPAPRVLVVGTARTEELPRDHPFNELRLRLNEESVITEIVLDALDAAETAALAAQVANRPFDAEATTRLFRKTEGNPLFVVEMLRSDGGHNLADGAALPPRVQAVIAGRLAQLSATARDVVSVAATVARACELSILARVLNCSELELVPALDELWEKRILREQEPNAYDFTHDRLREVAYEQISAPQRRSLHRIVARALENEESDLDRVSGQIAAHLDRAGLVEEAIPHYVRAAAAAQAVYANSEAQAQIERGLALVSLLPESSDRDARELELQLALAPIFRVTRGWATPELESVLDRALALSEKVGTPIQRTQVLYGLQSLYIVQGKHHRAQPLTDEIADLVSLTPGGERQLSAVAMMVGAKLARGRFYEAIDEWEELFRNLDPQQLRQVQDSQGLNYRVISSAWQSHALWCVGRPQKALARCLEAVALARDLAQPFNQAIAATYLALLQQLRADSATFRRQVDESLRLSIEFAAPYYQAWASILAAYAKACERPQAESIAEVDDAIQRILCTGARLRLPYYRALLADVCLRAHEPERGLREIENGLAAARQNNERWWDAELHRLRGELLVARGAGASEGDAAYRRALQIASAQGAKSLELRVAISLARLWGAAPASSGIGELLARTFGSFSEGFDTPDLIAARDLLTEIGLTTTA